MGADLSRSLTCGSLGTCRSLERLPALETPPVCAPMQYGCQELEQCLYAVLGLKVLGCRDKVVQLLSCKGPDND